MRVGVALALAALLCGCQSRLDIDQTFALDPNQSRVVVVEAPRYAQTVNVHATADEPFNVYLCLEKDVKDVEDALLKGKESDKVLAKSEKTKDATISGKTPAKTEAAVIVMTSTAKVANVKLKITGS